MGPFAFMSAIFGKTATTTTALLDSVETAAKVVNHWSGVALSASEIQSTQMLAEMQHENMIRSEELKAKLATYEKEVA